MWSLADDYADENGVLIGYTKEALDAEIGLKNFCEALPCEWIDLTGEWVKLPEYQDHNGNTAKRRAADQKRKKTVRTLSAKCPQPKRTKSGLEKRREEVKEKGEKEKRASRLSLDCIPSEWIAWTKGYNRTVDHQREFQKFSDYWLGAPGQKGVKADWFATWRNWIRRDYEEVKQRAADLPSSAFNPDGTIKEGYAHAH